MASVVHSSGGHHDHNPLHAHDEFSMANMVDTEGGVAGNGVGGSGDDPFEITAPQKMISAMSGSLLTSFLGESSHSIATFNIWSSENQQSN